MMIRTVGKSRSPRKDPRVSNGFISDMADFDSIWEDELFSTVAAVLIGPYRKRAREQDLHLDHVMRRKAGSDWIEFFPGMKALPELNGPWEGPLHVEVWMERDGMRVWQANYQIAELHHTEWVRSDLFEVLFPSK